MKINDQLRGIVAILLIFALINTGLIFWQLDRMSQDGNVVDYAGRQRAFFTADFQDDFCKISGVL